MYDEPMGMKPWNWDDYLRQQNRTGLAAGGATSAPEDPLAAGAQYDEPIGPDPSDEPQTPMDRFRQQERNFEAATGRNGRPPQGRPQQFGTAEPPHADDPIEGGGLVNPRTARSETPQQIRDRNANYDAYVQESRAKRDAEKARLREQGAMNRADAREKDADMWAAFRSVNNLQGGGSAFNEGGPTAANVGGAILLGPGFGRESHYGGYGGYGGYGRGSRGPSPEQLDLRERELAERIRKNRAMEGIGQGKLEEYGKKTQAAVDAETGKQKRFETTVELKDRKSAEDAFVQLQKALAEANRRLAAQKGGDANALDTMPPEMDKTTGKPIPGLHTPGTWKMVVNRILDLNRQLYNAHKKGVYDYQVTPDVIDQIKAFQLAADADKMGTPGP